MRGLRAINNRRRAFKAAPVSRSRRAAAKMAYGGFVDAIGEQNPEPVEGGRPTSEGNLTLERPLDYNNTSSGTGMTGFADGGKFDPEGSGYDMATARRAGLRADKTQHWPSREPKSGMLLKGRGHPTFNLTEQGEREAGYEIMKDKGSGRYYSHPRAPVEATGLRAGGKMKPSLEDKQHPAAKAMGMPKLADGGLLFDPNAQRLSASGAMPVKPMAGAIAKPKTRPTAPMKTGVGFNLRSDPLAAIRGTSNEPAPSRLGARVNPGDLAGLRGYQSGGLVDDEEEYDDTSPQGAYVSPGGNVATKPPLTVGQVSFDRPLNRYGAAPPVVDEAAAGLSRTPVPGDQQPLTAAQSAPASPEDRGVSGETFEMGVSPSELVERSIANRTAANRAAAGHPDAPAPAAAPVTTGSPSTGYVSDAEMAAGPRNRLLEHYGLRAGSTRDIPMGDVAPGVTKYVDPATGKTLYANTTSLSSGPPTPEQVKFAQGQAKADSDRLTAAIQARLASGHPQDLEAARQLAVTPEHRALIGSAANLAGLRAQAGRRGALAELQGRAAAQLEGLRGDRALQTALLSRMPTDLQLRQEARAEAKDVREAGATQRAENEKRNVDYIDRQFGTDDKGKADKAGFYNAVGSTPGPDGRALQIHELSPTQIGVLMTAYRVKQRLESGWFGSKQSSNLIDMLPTGGTEAGFFRQLLKTPSGPFSINALAGGDKGTRDALLRYASAR